MVPKLNSEEIYGVYKLKKSLACRYIIQKKSKHDREWKECARVGPQTSARVSSLKSGEEYAFRVIAKNKAGESKPSEPSRSQVAKHRNLAPKIDRAAMKAVTVRVGQSVEFNVGVTGEPPATKNWSFKSKPLDEAAGKTITVRDEDYMTHFVLRSATRAHAGTYTVSGGRVSESKKKTRSSAVKSDKRKRKRRAQRRGHRSWQGLSRRIQHLN